MDGQTIALMFNIASEFMSRSVMPRRYEPCIYVADHTPDGFAEVWVELNGREVARTVGCPANDVEENLLLMRGLMDEVRKRC